MSKYQIFTPVGHKPVIRRIDDDGTIWWFPCDVANTDYLAYLAWVEDGNVATEYTPELADNGS